MFATTKMPYAVNYEKSKGRLYQSSFSSLYNPFQEDVNRIIHSAAFRRLSYKTQVFVNDYTKSDYFRTRLTHSLEVAQIGKILATNMGLSVCLTEALCLVHDLGHPPFGHAGEDALCEITKGGFDHNVHCFKIVTELEERYMGYNGLNLTWEVLEGVVKHNWKNVHGIVPKVILNYSKQKQDLELDTLPSLEAQVSYLADDIAYIAHDIEDGLRAGLFDFDDLLKVKLISHLFEQIKGSIKTGGSRLPYKIAREITFYLIKDVINNTQKNIKERNIKTLDDVKRSSGPIVEFSKAVYEEIKEVRNFLYNNMYKNPELIKKLEVYMTLLKDLFAMYKKDPKKMPKEWFDKINDSDANEVILDYIAGMTDVYTIKQYYNFV